MIFEPDKFLQDIFGYPVYKVLVPSRGKIDWLGWKAPGFYWTRIATDDVSTLHQLGGLGFKVVDVNVTLVREPAGTLFYFEDKNIKMVEPEHYQILLEIAAQFECSRFHLDPAVPREIADRVKQAWLGNYFNGSRGEGVIVALDQDRPVGFLAILNNFRADTKIIDLIAVASDMREKGTGRRLVKSLVGTSPWSNIRVGTQVSNIASIRLYESCGFRAVKSEYVLHAHILA